MSATFRFPNARAIVPVPMVTAEVPERQAHLDVTMPRSRMHVQSPDACVRCALSKRLTTRSRFSRESLEIQKIPSS